MPAHSVLFFAAAAAVHAPLLLPPRSARCHLAHSHALQSGTALLPTIALSCLIPLDGRCRLTEIRHHGTFCRGRREPTWHRPRWRGLRTHTSLPWAPFLCR